MLIINHLSLLSVKSPIHCLLSGSIIGLIPTPFQCRVWMWIFIIGRPPLG